MNNCCTDTLLAPVAKVRPSLRGTPRFVPGSFYAINFPKLEFGQYALFIMEIFDGFDFFPEDRYLLDNARGRQVFTSFEAARQQAISNVTADPATECVICDASRQAVRVIRNGQPIPLEELLASLPKPSKKWWQVWRK